MGKKKQSFVVMNDFINFTDDLTDEQAGVLFKAMLAYSNETELPEMDIEVLTVFKYIKKKMDKNTEAYEKKCEINAQNGKIGGTKKAENTKQIETIASESSERYQTLANANETSENKKNVANASKPSEIYHDNDSDNDINKKSLSKDKPKKEKSFFADDDINKEFLAYLEMRKANKKPVKTDRQITLAINKLYQLAGDGSGGLLKDKCIELIQTATVSGWQSFYPVTETKSRDKPKSCLEMTRDYNFDEYEKLILSN